MKFLASLSAALVAAAVMVPGVASADRVRVVETTRTVHTERHNDDRGRWGWRKVCHMERHHGHRSRICKNVRYRR